MSNSKQEELIGVLWLIAGICALGFDYVFWGWVLIVKGSIDQLYSIFFAIKSFGSESER